jgi:6-phosphogluconolactonase (cycloisomerase 2 family)
MKFSKLSQLFLVSSLGLLVAALLTACQLVTIDYVFVANSAGSGPSSAGQIGIYALDNASGAIRPAATTVQTGTSGPVAMAVSSDYAHLYVANTGNNSVIHFTVASDGTLTKADTVTLASAPVSLVVNAANTYLYVVSGTSSATLTEYALSAGVIGSATSTQQLRIGSDTVLPTGVFALANNNAVYVSAYDQSAYNPGCTPTPPATSCITSNANPGWVFAFTVGTSGALNPSANSPYAAGIKPSAVTADPTNRFVYVTDYASSELIGYAITACNAPVSAAGCQLSFLINGPFKTGYQPSALAIDPRGKFIYVANALDNSVSAFNIDLTTGTPAAAVNPTGSATNSTDGRPVALAIDPAIGRFVFTANHDGNSVSGFVLDPTAGTLGQTQATPYPAGYQPTAIVMVPHGNHSVQSVTP